MANDTRRAKTKMEDDLKLIKKKKKTGDEESLSKLIERHSGIYIEFGIYLFTISTYIPECLLISSFKESLSFSFLRFFINL